MGEPEKATARLQCGGSEIFQLEVGGGRENLQKLGQTINQFLTNIIEQKTREIDGNDEKDDEDADDSDSSEDNVSPKKLKLSQ